MCANWQYFRATDAHDASHQEGRLNTIICGGINSFWMLIDPSLSNSIACIYTLAYSLPPLQLCETWSLWPRQTNLILHLAHISGSMCCQISNRIKLLIWWHYIHTYFIKELKQGSCYRDNPQWSPMLAIRLQRHVFQIHKRCFADCYSTTHTTHDCTSSTLLVELISTW